MPGVAKSEEVAGDSYFYNLVRPGTPKKKRQCLKCRTVFLSANYGNRVCGSCAAQNTRAAVRANSVY
jgi:hypothetical protein